MEKWFQNVIKVNDILDGSGSFMSNDEFIHYDNYYLTNVYIIQFNSIISATSFRFLN